MKRRKFTLIYGVLILLILVGFGRVNLGWAGQTGNGCLNCHKGIESIMPQDNDMMLEIGELGGDHGPCVVCHGGNPAAKTEKEAHQGAPEEVDAETFYPDPGSLWIADKTCGVAGCHEGYVYRLMRTVKNTEIGKIQGNEWAWGIHPMDRTPRYSNYALDDPDGPSPAVGSKAYKEYIGKLIEDKSVLNLFAIPSVKEIPNPSPEEIEKNPALAAYAYSRIECQRCHVGVRGRARRGDYRGMGCSSCHIPYSNEGFYEGRDPTIPRDKAGHLLVHEIQSSRKMRNGIPIETCTTCHNRGKRIGVSFQGLMEFPYGTPFNEKGEGQAKLHTKKYIFVKEDLHHQWESRPENPSGGMLCQDCHTTIEMHGDGNIFGTTLAQVEIECTDCHGTPDSYPWELPIGFMDEFGRKLDGGPRGTTEKLLSDQQLATVYESEGGYLLTARGNPYGNVVRRGKKVIVHSATGRDYRVPVLKNIHRGNRWRSLAGKVAKVSIPAHLEKAECYSCHSNWVPQCYGCHVKMDFSKGKKSFDWVISGNSHLKNGLTLESLSKEEREKAMAIGVAVGTGSVDGAATESRSYLRWEDPVLGINGEGRVTPIMPGCQVTTTVFGRAGQLLVLNKQWIGPDGIRGMDMAPAQPHTAARAARSCPSCHASPKALGYGIEDGRFQQNDTNIVIDLKGPDGQVITKKGRVQIPAIPEMDFDWSQVVTRDGKQTHTVGSHWTLSGPLPKEMRDKMERTGVCFGCHQLMGDEKFWSKVTQPGYLTDQEHWDLMRKAIEAFAEGVSKK
jgi:hypothetical protein